MSDEVERRIEEARKKAQRESETKEFLESLTKDSELVKPIYNPEAFVMRDKATGAANRGQPPPKCPHPQSAVRQYVEENPSRNREGLPINLFACNACSTLLWLVDAWGRTAGDG